MKRLVLGGLLLLMAAGCSSMKFVYKPGEYPSGGRKLPVDVAVLPFEDGTENFTKREVGGSSNDTIYSTNIVKSYSGTWQIPLTDPLIPEVWSKSFAEELAASGAFRSVRFLFSPSEPGEEDLYVEGTIRKAYLNLPPTAPSEYALALRARRRTDQSILWEKSVESRWNHPWITDRDCPFEPRCLENQRHAQINRVMQGLFREAATDLAARLESASWPGTGSSGGTGADGNPPGAPPAGPAPGSVDETVESILKEK
jgi:hypothetical protein